MGGMANAGVILAGHGMQHKEKKVTGSLEKEYHKRQEFGQVPRKERTSYCN